MALIWKDIRGYEGKYQISNTGAVRSLKRNGVGASARKTTKLLKLGRDKDGYLHVGLSANGEHKTMRVHRLVVETFVRKITFGEQINHKNFDVTDNRLENLEICTAKENMLHFYKHNKLKLSWDDIQKIIKLVKGGMTQSKVADIYGIHQADVSNYVNGKRRIYQY